MAFSPDYTPPPRIQIWPAQPAPTEGRVAIPPPAAQGPVIVGTPWDRNGNNTTFEPLALSPNTVPQFVQKADGTTSEIRGATQESAVRTKQNFFIFDMNLFSLGFEQQ